MINVVGKLTVTWSAWPALGSITLSEPGYTSVSWPSGNLTR